jgi:threonine dehydrogenase-like Zn-dependent dehydrogenase
VGEVIEIGPGVSGFSVGDLTAVFNMISCKKCGFCRRGLVSLCPEKKVIGVNTGAWGAMAEYFIYPADCLFKVDAKTDPAIALLAEPIGIATHAVGLTHVNPDDTVAIIGTGTIGLALVILLKAMGIKHIYALARNARKLSLADEFGATVINTESQDAAKIIRDATGGLGADVVFEAVGAAATVRSAFDLCAPGATLVLIGNLAREATIPLQSVTTNEVTIRGSYGFTRNDFAKSLEWIRAGTAPLHRLITGSCTLEETPGVMTRLANGQLSATKMVIRL